MKLKKINLLPLTAFFGKIDPPAGVDKYVGGEKGQGLFTFLNNILKLLIFGAGLFTLFNLILGGYGFLSASGEPEKVAQAWAKIWQSLLGLLIVASSFILAGVVGQIFFGDPKALIVPKLYGPGD